MMKFWRENVWAAGIITFLRVYLGYKWVTSAWGKVTGGEFDATGFLTKAIETPVSKGGEVLYPLYTDFIEHLVLPNVDIINFLIPWGELLVGIGLIVGVLTIPAAFFGLLMNFMFLFAGTVSTNPLMVLVGFLIIIAGTNAGKFGGDYFVAPWLKKNVWSKLVLKFKKG